MNLTKEEVERLSKEIFEDTFGNRDYSKKYNKYETVDELGFHESELESLIKTYWVREPKFKTHELAILKNKKRFLSKKTKIPGLEEGEYLAYILNPYYKDFSSEFTPGKYEPSRVGPDGSWNYHATIYKVEDNEGVKKVEFKTTIMKIPEKLLSKLQ